MKLKVIACIALLIISSFTSLGVQVPGPSSLDESMLTKIDAYVASSLEAAHISSAAVRIFSVEETLFTYSKGEVKTQEERFIIGSTSKSFTAVAIMQLVEKGLIDLDAPCSTYLPAGILPGSLADQITVRQLLNQTSGVQAHYIKDIKSLQQQGSFHYANANYSLLGEMVASVSGQSYTEYMQANVFSPLAMGRTSATAYNEQPYPLITSYSTVAGLQLPVKQPRYDSEFISAGYIASTAIDMEKYLRMYLRGGQTMEGASVLQAGSIQQMFTPPAADTKYGMGWVQLERDGQTFLFHNGAAETFSAQMAVFPEQGIGFVMLFSASDIVAGTRLSDKLSFGLVQLLAGEEPAPPDRSAYWKQHGIVDAILVVSLAIAVVPILRIKSWKKKWKDKLSKLFGECLNCTECCILCIWKRKRNHLCGSARNAKPKQAR